MLLLLRKKRGEKSGMRITYFWSGPLPDMASSSHVTGVTSGQKALLGWIWRNFRLRMHRRYFRTMTNVISDHVTDVTSGHVTSGHAQWSDPPHDPTQMLTECTHILLIALPVKLNCHSLLRPAMKLAFVPVNRRHFDLIIFKSCII